MRKKLTEEQKQSRARTMEKNRQAYIKAHWEEVVTEAAKLTTAGFGSIKFVPKED